MRIRDDWRSYFLNVMDPEAEQVQITECRRAFYAGARSMLTLVSLPDVRVEDLEKELAGFSERVRQGDA